MLYSVAAGHAINLFCSNSTCSIDESSPLHLYTILSISIICQLQGILGRFFRIHLHILIHFSLVQVATDSKDPKDSPLARQRRASESDTLLDQRPSRSAHPGRSAEEAGAAMKGEGSNGGGASAAPPRNVDIMQMLYKAQDEYDKVSVHPLVFS